MPFDAPSVIFIGIKGSVLALDERTGGELWRTKLRASDYVTVLWDGKALLAATGGEIWRLDPAGGGVLWQNKLKGLGLGLLSVASTRRPDATANADLAVEIRRKAAAAAAAAG